MPRIVLPAITLTCLLVILHVWIVRPYYMRWGATNDELTMAMPGDSLFDKTAVISTRAITIKAPVSVVWSWLVQIGQGRGGYYTYQWLENLFATHMVNADSISPQLQELKVGDSIFFHRSVPPGQVAILQPRQCLVLTGGWTFSVYARGTDETRLIVRYPFPVKNFAVRVFYFTVFEPTHFITEAGMMMGLKYRAENAVRPTPDLSLPQGHQ